jgi:flagellar biosynthesis/type III secretory pathway M-ring protein FliF/YscJ
VVPTDTIEIRLQDVAKEDKWFRTSEDKRAQRLIVLQNWLGDVIAHMENIRAASVALDAPDQGDYVLANEKGTAAVTVWLKAGVEQLSREQVNGIAALVAGVRRTVPKSNVNIIDNHGRQYRVPGSDEADGMVSERHEQQMMYERRLARSVEEMLSFFNPVKVMVKLKIDFDRTSLETVDVDPDKVVAVETRTTTSENTSSTGNSGTSGSTPGVAAAVGTGGATTSTETKEDKLVKSEAYKKITRTIQAPGEVKDIAVSVLVPRDQVIEQLKARGVKVDEKAADQAVTAELDRLKQVIMTGLNITEPAKVLVDAVTFTRPSLPEEKAAAGMAGYMQYVTQYGGTAGLALLTLVALFFLWRMVKRPVEVSAPSRPMALTDEELLVGLDGPDESVRRAEKVEEKVAEMVKQSPRDAASLITRWVQTEG